MLLNLVRVAAAKFFLGTNVPGREQSVAVEFLCTLHETLNDADPSLCSDLSKLSRRFLTYLLLFGQAASQNPPLRNPIFFTEKLRLRDPSTPKMQTPAVPFTDETIATTISLFFLAASILLRYLIKDARKQESSLTCHHETIRHRCVLHLVGLPHHAHYHCRCRSRGKSRREPSTGTTHFRIIRYQFGEDQPRSCDT